jgi:hypothetical protein
MASYANKYFGIKNGPNVKDYKHANRLHTTRDMAFAPKTKYLYHVVFNMIGGVNNTINMLVKGADLPKFNVQVDTLNQYNRKKNTQVKIDYQPVQIKFHDDNAGLTRGMWEQYFSYYFADPTSAKSQMSYIRNATKSGGYVTSNYGLDNGSVEPFFRDITIYQMGKRQWNSYKLINPVVQAWTHDTLDSSSSAPAEQSMTVLYESVAYDSGFVSQGNPPGFGLENYDGSMSPATMGNIGRIAGAIQGVTSIFGAVSSGQAFNTPLTALATAVTAVNTYQNIKNISGASTTDRIIGGLAGISAIGAGLGNLSQQGVSGVQNIAFPVVNALNTVTATARTVSNLQRVFKGG